MADSSFHRATMLLYIVLGLVFAIEGALVLVRGLSVERDPQLVCYGAVELISAALFIWPRTIRLGACGLVCAFLVAAVVHVVAGEFPSEHLASAVAVAFVTIHSARSPSPYGRAAA